MGSHLVLTAIIIFTALLFSTSEFGIVVVSGFRCVNGGFLHRKYSTPLSCAGRALRVKCTTENGAGAVGEREPAKEVREVDQEIDKEDVKKAERQKFNELMDSELMPVKIKGITRRRVTRRIDRATSENFEEHVLNERTQAWLRYEAGKVMGPKIIKKVRRRADELGVTIPKDFFPGRNRYKYKRKQMETATLTDTQG